MGLSSKIVDRQMTDCTELGLLTPAEAIGAGHENRPPYLRNGGTGASDRQPRQAVVTL